MRENRYWRDKASGQYGQPYGLVEKKYIGKKIRDDESWIFAETQLEFREKYEPKSYRCCQID
jgi:hypothetical protein